MDIKKTLIIVASTIVCLTISGQTIEKTYHFDNPTTRHIDQYEQIDFEGCLQSSQHGCPIVPWQKVCLILPPHTEAASFDIEFSDYVEFGEGHQLYPRQSVRAYSDTTRHIFEKNINVYSTDTEFPVSKKGKLTTQHLNGVSIALCSFTPIAYHPLTGRLSYATKAKVKINAVPSTRTEQRSVWLTPSNKLSIERLTQNPEAIEPYIGDANTLPEYDILIITTPTYDPNVIGDADQISFAQYIDFYAKRGLRARCANTDDIAMTSEGRDLAEQIRNYIIEEYDHNGISMVLLGGDTQLVPYRGFYCDVLSGGDHITDYDIPADLYYAALDGTWNDNDDELWGEESEDDLLPEISIGRTCFNNLNEFANIMHKTMKYQETPILGEFRNVTFGGEFLYGDPYSLGSDYLELLIGQHDDNGYTTYGIPDDYYFKRLYYETNTWSDTNLVAAINNGTQYVHHQGHANFNYVAGLMYDDITDERFFHADGINHNYTFMHTSGCICGDFSRECILERMTQISNFAVATVGNSRYGWFNEGQTEGPAIHLERETLDAFFHERIPYIGAALREAKTQTAPWVTAPGQWEEGALRWNFYCLNLLGDVATAPWNDEPFTPTVVINNNDLTDGSNKININVKDENDNGLLNFTCNVFKNDTLIGRNITNTDGNTEVELTEHLTEGETIKIITTGENAWYQTKEIKINSDGATDINEDINIYPNPAIDYIIVNCQSPCKIKIFNNLGQETTSKQIQGTNKIGVSDLPSGIYHLNIENCSESKIIKFVKL